MKKVALVGFARSCNYPAWDLPDDVELWTLNHTARLGLPRIDRLFDMHQWELIIDPHFLVREYQQDHHEYLQEDHDFPIYMVAKYPQVSASTEYPIEKVKFLAGKYRRFTSSFCYMIAMAILEDYKFIGVYGFSMEAETEYEYQRDEALKWINYAEGLGITVDIPPESGLNSRVNLLYGYEGIPMVSRQSIESYVKAYKMEEEKSEAEMFTWQGILAERSKNGSSRRKKKEAQEMVNGFMRQAAMNEGASRAMKFLLDECDMIELEPLLTDDQLVEMQKN